MIKNFEDAIKKADEILDWFKSCCCLSDKEVDEAALHNLYFQIPKEVREFYPFSYTSGATKAVLVMDNLDFVIKIPFSGEWYDRDEYFDGELDEWVYKDGYFQFFEGAFNYDFHWAGSEWNYCEKEAVLYSKSLSNEVSDAFCATYLLGYVHDYPIYIQKKAAIFSDVHNYNEEETRPSSTTAEKVMEDVETYDTFPISWATDMVEYFGEEFFRKFLEFLTNEGIRDFHGGNIGYIGKVPVMVDYSSYNE